MLRPIFWLLLASAACAQLTVRERLQSNLQDQRFAQPQQVSQPAVTQSRLAQQPFLGQDSLVKPLPVVQRQQTSGQIGQTQGVLRQTQQQLGRLRLEEIRREQEFRRQQEIQRRQAARRQLEARRRQQDLQRQEESRRREAARLRLESERQRQEETVRQQERQRQQEELRQRQENLRLQALERRQLQANIPTLDDVRDGPFQDGTYYFGYATGNGIVREEGTRLTGPYTHEVTGSYSYTAPNGEVIAMEYIADENGYRAYRARPGRVNPVIPPNRIFETPPYRPPTISPLENRPFSANTNRPRPLRPATNRPIFGSTNQRPQLFNTPITQRPQTFSSQVTPRPQIIPRPQNLNAAQPQTFTTNVNFNSQDVSRPQTFSVNQPANTFSDPIAQQPQTFDTNAFSRRLGLDDILTVPEDEYDYGGTLTQAVLGAQPPSTFVSESDI